MTLLRRITANTSTATAPLILLVLLAGLQGPEESGESFHTAVVANTIGVLAFAIPVMCLGGAWEASKIRASGILRQPWARSSWAFLGRPYLLTIAPMLALFAIMIAIRVRPVGMDWAMLALAFLAIAGWGLLAFSLGLVVTRLVALPVALIVPALVLVLARTNTPYWLRHTTGMWTGCCMANQDPAWQSLLASFLGVVAVILVSVALLQLTVLQRGDHVWSPSARGPLALAATLVLVTPLLLLPAPQLLGGFDYRSGIPRTSVGARCSGNQPVICLWPEHEPLRQRMTTIAQQAYAKWSALGIVLPPKLDEGAFQSAGDTRPMLLNLGANDTELTASLAAAVGVVEGCPGPSASTGVISAMTDRDNNAWVAFTWLMATAGVGWDSIERQVPPPTVQAARDLLTQPDAAVTVNAMLAVAARC